MRLLTGLLLLLITFISMTETALAASPPMTCEEIQARMEQLSEAADEAEGTDALAGIEAEMDSLAMQYAARCLSGLPSLPVPIPLPSPENMVRAATAEQEAKRQRDAVNILWRQFQQNPNMLKAGAGERVVPISQAIPVEGRIDIAGGFKSNPYRGWVWHDISYKVVETFVGNLIVVRHFDRKAGVFTGKEDYLLHTISTGIGVPELSGRKCLRASAELPGRCVDWQEFRKHRVEDGEIYPGAQAGVISAETKDEKVTLVIHSPSVLFRSNNGKAADKLGCYGNRSWTAAEFKELIRQSEIRFTLDVGSPSQATPGCRPGSSISLELKIRPE